MRLVHDTRSMLNKCESLQLSCPSMKVSPYLNESQNMSMYNIRYIKNPNIRQDPGRGEGREEQRT